MNATLNHNFKLSGRGWKGRDIQRHRWIIQGVDPLYVGRAPVVFVGRRWRSQSVSTPICVCVKVLQRQGRVLQSIDFHRSKEAHPT